METPIALWEIGPRGEGATNVWLRSAEVLPATIGVRSERHARRHAPASQGTRLHAWTEVGFHASGVRDRIGVSLLSAKQTDWSSFQCSRKRRARDIQGVSPSLPIGGFAGRKVSGVGENSSKVSNPDRGNFHRTALCGKVGKRRSIRRVRPRSPALSRTPRLHGRLRTGRGGKLSRRDGAPACAKTLPLLPEPGVDSRSERSATART